MFKSGFVTIVGKPNSGKSTLLNALIGYKVSIATPKKNTTRNQIKGIYNDNDSQIVFIDTPGFLSKKSKLEETMQKRITESLKGVDVVLYLLPFWKELDDEYLNSIEFTKNTKAKKYILLTKIDKLNNHEDLYKKANQVGGLDLFDKIIPISSLKGKNLNNLLEEIKKDLKEDVAYYDKDKFHEYNDNFYISEIIREKALMKLSDEIPHELFVNIESLKISENRVKIFSEIILSRETLKQIVIGKDGKMIKSISNSSRKELEGYFDKKVDLEIFVKVKKDWQNKENVKFL